MPELPDLDLPRKLGEDQPDEVIHHWTALSPDLITLLENESLEFPIGPD